MPDLMNLINGGFTMPHALIPLPDVYETVTRRVAVDVIRQLRDLMQLPDDTQVYLPGNAGTIPMNNGTFGECCANRIVYDPEARMVVSYDEVADESFTLTTAVNNNQNLPLFNDPVRDITIRPVRRYVDLRFDIEYQAPGIVVAQRWLDDMRIRFSAGAAESVMNLQYHYNMPESQMAILRAMYDTIQCSDWPIQEEFEVWCDNHFTYSKTTVATLAGTHPLVTIRERQWDVLGWFEFGTNPDTPKANDDRAGAYTVTMSFFMRYDRPTHVYCKYPLVAHQNIIPELFWPAGVYTNYQQVERHTTGTRGPLDASFVLPRPLHIPYIQYPPMDDWVTDMNAKESFTFFNGLCVIEKTDLRTLLDLTDLGDYEFSPWFLEYFKTVGSDAIGKTGMFYATLYENNEWRRTELVLDTDTMTIKSPVDLDPLKYYHVRLSIQTNWYAVFEAQFQCLRNYPYVFWTMCNMFRVGVGRKPYDQLRLMGANRRKRVESDCCQGEGTTDITKDVVTTTGVVYWEDIVTAREEMDEKGNAYVGQDRVGPLQTLLGEIITLKRTNNGSVTTEEARRVR